VVTLRGSMIGQESGGGRGGLLSWFLSQHGSCKGFTRAIFSGLPTNVWGEIIRDYIIPKSSIYGLYHVAARPISKYDLLTLISYEYNKKITIIPDDSVVIDRSLSAARLYTDTGYIAPEWPNLISIMRSNH